MKTRMTKSNLHLIIYIVLCIFSSACENEIPYYPKQQEPQLVMNALLEADKNDNRVYLYLSEGNKFGRINEATLSLYVNGQLAESPKELPLQEIANSSFENPTNEMPEVLPSVVKHKVFRLTTVFHPGDNIRLESIAEHGKYHVSAEVTVPQPVDEVQVDTCASFLRKYNRLYPYRQYKITVKDRPNEKNYYRLEMAQEFSYRCEYINNTVPDTIINMRNTEFINREDMILTDGHPTSSDEEENEFFPTIENKYNIFNDNRFSNTSATLKVYAEYYEKVYPDYIFHQLHRSGTITIRLLSITEAEYRYQKALNGLDSDDYDETLMEPISLPCNVNGGLGFVGACAVTKKMILFPETALFKFPY